MICSPGDTVVVPFPFLERPVVKVRPAVVISASAFNRRNGHTILSMITTGAGSSWPGDIPIADIDAAGLSHRSVIRPKTFTLPNALLRRSIGQLSQQDAQTLRDTLRGICALGGA